MLQMLRHRIDQPSSRSLLVHLLYISGTQGMAQWEARPAHYMGELGLGPGQHVYKGIKIVLSLIYIIIAQKFSSYLCYL